MTFVTTCLNNVIVANYQTAGESKENDLDIYTINIIALQTREKTIAIYINCFHDPKYFFLLNRYFLHLDFLKLFLVNEIDLLQFDLLHRKVASDDIQKGFLKSYMYIRKRQSGGCA